MSVEALLGTDVAFAAAYQLARPHPGPGRRRDASCATSCATAGSSTATTSRATRSRTRTRSAACRRSTAPSATRSTTCGGCSTSSSTPRPTTRSSSRAAGSPPVDAMATGGGRVISGGNFHGEPIALALDFAKLGARRARVDQRAADRAPRRSAAERRAAAVPRGRLRHRLGDDDLPVHGGRPGQRAQGPRASVLGRLDPDEREPGGPRLDGRDRRPATPGRCSKGSSGSSSIELLVATQALDLRLAPADSPAPGSASSRRGPASVRSCRISTRIASPAPISRRRSTLCTGARWSTSPADGRPPERSVEADGQRRKRDWFVRPLARSSTDRTPARRSIPSISVAYLRPSGRSSSQTR